MAGASSAGRCFSRARRASFPPESNPKRRQVAPTSVATAGTYLKRGSSKRIRLGLCMFVGTPALGGYRERHRITGGKRRLECFVEKDFNAVFECHARLLINLHSLASGV
jgi:hypothetical protein